MRAAAANLVILAGILVRVMLSVSVAYSQTSIDGTLDIAALMDAAESRFDLTNEDAVILYDSRAAEWTSDGRLTDRIHRIIWIGTSIGIEDYGDHRIPYDHSNRSFTVTTVRTWMGGRWWVTGETGIVETLPFAVNNAYDYTNVREMMLLHDGIELPCILEVSYAVEDKRPFRKGAEGMWLFARENPAVRSVFSLTLPSGHPYKLYASDAVPDATTSGKNQVTTHTWSMGPLDAIPHPKTDDPAAYVPHITWSTWGNWSDFAIDLRSTFESGMILGEELMHRLDSIANDARTDAEMADLMASFVNKVTRLVDFSYDYWLWSPRTAERTYSTAYAHSLDRTLLAAALFEQVGFEICPVFVADGYGDVDEGVPSIARVKAIGLRVSSGDLDGYYDPESGAVTGIPLAFMSKAVWSICADDGPRSAATAVAMQNSRFDLSIELEYDDEKESFTGCGFMTADNCLNPVEKMRGLSDEAESYLGSLISSVVDGATISTFSLERFDDREVVVGFEFELEEPDLDDFDRIPLSFDQPSGGIATILPSDVNLYHQRRSSPVHLPSTVTQTVTVRIDSSDLEIVYIPAEQSISSECGDFELSVDDDDGELVLQRSLTLKKALYDAAEWADLRSLLLVDQHERNQTVLLRKSGETEDNDDE